MADKRISQLTDRGTVANSDVVPIVVSGAVTTNKATISSIQTFMQGNLDLGVTSVGITFGTSGTDINASGSPVTSSGNITINLPTASATNRGALSAADWSTFNSKQGAITLTTTGTSGVSTLVGNTLNIPNYTTDLSGYVTLGTAQTITAQKTFTTSGSSDTMIISHGSGSGFALDVIKAGSGEAIRVQKTSGSGNAMTISGGNFEAGTIVKTGGTSSQFLKADGSVDSSTYLTTGTAASTYVPYTGATTSVDLGDNVLTSGGLNVDSLGGFGGALNLRQATSFSLWGGAPYTSIYATTGNNLKIYFSNDGRTITLNGSLVSAASPRTFTFPDATGTLALTTDLGAYLPLTGGTLTGALNGTSATFSGVGTFINSSSGASTTGLVVRNSGSTVVGTESRLFLSTVGGDDRGAYISSIITSSSNDNALVFATNSAGAAPTEKLRIASTGAATFSSSVTAGNKLIVTNSSPAQFASSSLELFSYNGSSTSVGTSLFSTNNDFVYGTIISNQTNLYGVRAGGIRIATAVAPIVFSNGNADIDFATERMRITSTGNVGIGTASPTRRLHVEQAASGFTEVARLANTSNNASGDFAFVSVLGSNTSNTNSYHYIALTGAADKLYIYGNGNVVNTNNSYGALSDIKIKENVVEASDKLDDLMKVKVRNFNYIGDDKKQIGVIAQELEEIFPAMIDESEDFEEVEVPQLDKEGNEVLNEEGEVVTTKQRVSKGTTTKSVKYSVFVPMLIKAIQELKAEIDSLKNQIK